MNGYGNVFVADINTGLWKIDAEGKLTHIDKEAGHWLALDAAGKLRPREFHEVGPLAPVVQEADA